MAEDEIGKAVLVLSTKAKELLEGIDKAKAASESLQNKFNSVSAGVQDALAAIGLGVSFSALIHETAAAEDAEAQLQSALQATGNAAGFTSEQLIAQAKVLQNVTRFSDEAIMGMQTTLLQFQNIQGEVFRRAEQAALNFASATGRSATDAARTLGLALNDPTEGMNMLRRAGVSLGAGIKETIKTLADNGDVVQAQTILLDEFNKAMAGRAVASAKTLGGALDQLKNKFSDTFLEVKGPARDTFVEFVNIVKDNMASIAAVGAAAFAALKAVVDGVVERFFYFGEALVKLAHRDVKGALDSLKKIPSAMNIAGEAVSQATKAFVETKAGMEQLEKQNERVAASAAHAAGGIVLVSQAGLAAAEAAKQSAIKATESVGSIIQGPLVTAEMSFDQLVLKAQEASQRATAAAQLAGASAQMGLTTAAQSAARLAQTYSAQANQFAAAARATMERTAAAIQNLKVSTAGSIGELLGTFQRGAISFEDFSRRVLIAIAKMIAQMIVLKAFGAGTMGAGFGGGLVSGLFGGFMADGGQTQAGKAYIVGERGPELFMPDRSGAIVPNAGPEGGKSVSIVQHFSLTGIDLSSADAARRLLQAAAAQMRAGAIEALAFQRAAADQMTLQPRRAF